MASTRSKLILRAFAVGISAIPLYGYFVHASKDSQIIGLIIIASWLLTCLVALVALGILIVRRYRNRASKFALLATVYLFAMAAVGYGGVQKAFIELLAG